MILYEEEKITAILNSAGTDKNEHSGRQLSDHLKGTYDLLVSWDNPATVSMAGLLHSVYGTANYEKQTVPPEDRNKIKKLIGKKAEELAYIFCVMSKEALFNNAGRTENYFIETINKENIPVSETVFKQLVEIAYANFIEQLPALNRQCEKTIIVELFEKWAVLYGYVSPKAKEGFMKALSEVEV